MKWEYKIIDRRDLEERESLHGIERWFNQQGKDNWECITVDNFYYFFKRPKAEPA